MKRLFEFFFALFGLFVFGGLLLLCVFIAAFDTKSSGLFFQKRIGLHGKPFDICKIKTLKDNTKQPTRFGSFLRKYKLDELPQLINILTGKMSFVGPRPDISGYADALTDSDREFLSLKPGITGLASIKYRNEEELLAQQPYPRTYNDTVIWPDKVRINNWYTQNRTFAMDFKIIIHTIYPSNFHADHYINSHPQKKHY